LRDDKYLKISSILKCSDIFQNTLEWKIFLWVNVCDVEFNNWKEARVDSGFVVNHFIGLAIIANMAEMDQVSQVGLLPVKVALIRNQNGIKVESMIAHDVKD
jgi:hypothetical protein